MLFSEDTESPERTYALTDTRLKELQQLTWHMYGQIVEPYRIAVARPVGQAGRKAERLVAGFQEELAKRLSGRAVLLYPRSLPPCDASAQP